MCFHAVTDRHGGNEGREGHCHEGHQGLEGREEHCQESHEAMKVVKDLKVRFHGDDKHEGCESVKAMKTMKVATGMKTSTKAPMKGNKVPDGLEEREGVKAMKALKGKDATEPEEKERYRGNLVGYLARQTIPGCGHNCIGEIKEQTRDEYLLLFLKGWADADLSG